MLDGEHEKIRNPSDQTRQTGDEEIRLQCVFTSGRRRTHEREAMLGRVLSCLAPHAGAPAEWYGSQLTPHAEVLPQHRHDG